MNDEGESDGGMNKAAAMEDEVGAVEEEMAAKPSSPSSNDEVPSKGEENSSGDACSTPPSSGASSARPNSPPEAFHAASVGNDETKVDGKAPGCSWNGRELNAGDADACVGRGWTCRCGGASATLFGDTFKSEKT